MKIFIVFGTRPEAIKLISLINELKKRQFAEIKVCVTSQHDTMLAQVLELFNIVPDYDLKLMKPNQNLAELTQAAMGSLYDLFAREKPDRVLVHGDTTTTFVASLAAFYHKIPVGHIEAGLRSYNRYSPWPEEIYRQLTSCIADMHFAPTTYTAENLVREGISANEVFVTGNTVVDLLLQVKQLIMDKALQTELKDKFSFLDSSKKLILVTAHRRESFGKSFEHMCKALARIAEEKNVEIIFPVHLNPNVREPVHQYLKNLKNVFLIDPVDYFSMVYLQERCYMILTDSGGIQEEAPTFGKPLLVMRNLTERTEGIAAGVSKLVGTDMQAIIDETLNVLHYDSAYNQMTCIVNPYGDGKAAQRIADLIEAKM